MQKGIIKEVRAIDSEGKTTFYNIELQDGLEMTSFDPKVKQAEPGDGIEYDVGVSKKGTKTYINLKDGFTITKSASSVSPGTSKGNGYPEMSKEEWAEKQRIERDSIEAQVAVKCIFGLRENLNTMGILPNDAIANVIDKALNWCEVRIDATMMHPVKPVTKAPAKTKTTKKEKPESVNPDEVEFDASPVQNFGDLWTRSKKIGVSKEKGLEILNVESQVLIVDLDKAWKTIFDHEFEKPKESVPEEIPFN